NRELVDSIVSKVDIKVELSGGIRDAASLTAALASGCRRVNLGTAALERPEWTAEAIAEHGDRIAVGLDVRGTTLAARGWTRNGGDLWKTLERLDREDCARYGVTDVNRDGMLAWPHWPGSAPTPTTSSAPGCTSRSAATATRWAGSTPSCSAPTPRWRRWSSFPGCSTPTCASRSRSRPFCPTPEPDEERRMTDTDSAGIPWTGRYLSGTGYDDDEGGADPELADALAEAHDRPSAEADARLARAAAVARWLVPVVA